MLPRASAVRRIPHIFARHFLTSVAPLAGWLGLLTVLACTAAIAAPAGAGPPRGLPYIRTYPLDEIGSVPRGLRLGFDAFGRVAVMYDGIYAVLNDSAWVERIDPASASKVRMTTIRVADGRYYYGGRGSWGTVEMTADGHFSAKPLVPADAPAWTSVTPFNNLLGTSAGMYFNEINGVVYWDFAQRKNIFFAMPRLSAAFPVGERVFASCQDHQIRELLPASGAARIATVAGLDGQVVTFAAPLDRSHTLLALEDGRLVSFDGDTAMPWRPQSEHQISGRIAAMERLVDGGVAIAVADQGLSLLSSDGSLAWSLLLPEFRRVSSMAAGEPGVLWVAGENAIHRIFYDSPLTSFGQQLGLAAIWPQVAGWNNQIVVCSSRTLYEMSLPQPGHAPAFRVLAGSPARPVDFIAASESHLLAGTPVDVCSVGSDGRISSVIPIANVAGLEFIDPDTCIVVGSQEIAALKQVEGTWVECAPRIAGVGDSPIHLQKHGPDSLWVEMGGDRVARLTLRHGVLAMQRIPLPWRGEQWTNVGVLGNTVILSGASGQRTYYDEAREALCDAPALDKLLNRSPYWLLRVKEDASGVLWATHAQGVVTFTPQGGDYVVDSATFELPNDSYPAVTILPANNTWIAAGRSLYHVEPRAPRNHGRAHPMLVSLVADHQNLELLSQTGLPLIPPRFSFDDNSLSFRFFSGTYARRSPPAYEYRLGPSDSWTPVDPNLLLRFPKLRDGAYRLEVRPAGPDVVDSPPFALAFVIKPPWYRTPGSYAVYSLALLLSLVGIARWINHRSLKRNAELERLVHERTGELEVTMEKLGEESRNAATLAERSRLAGEIHDSIQQGLSGTILHLDTTMTHPSINPEVHAQLNIMRNMLSYTREEVQQAVWDLESPLLQNSTLGDALRKLAASLRSGSIAITVTAQAEPAPLDSTSQHNLLRIAQEAITNAVKHAEASRIGVTLESHSDSVVLTVADDGKGFDPAARPGVGGHLGLRGLRSRAKSIKGRLQIISAPGAGTTVQVTVPLPALHSHDSDSQNKPA